MSLVSSTHSHPCPRSLVLRLGILSSFSSVEFDAKTYQNGKISIEFLPLHSSLMSPSPPVRHAQCRYNEKRMRDRSVKVRNNPRDDVSTTGQMLRIGHEAGMITWLF